MSRKDNALAISSVSQVSFGELDKLLRQLGESSGQIIQQSQIDRQAKKVIESLDALKAVIKIVRR